MVESREDGARLASPGGTKMNFSAKRVRGSSTFATGEGRSEGRHDDYADTCIRQGPLFAGGVELEGWDASCGRRGAGDLQQPPADPKLGTGVSKNRKRDRDGLFGHIFIFLLLHSSIRSACTSIKTCRLPTQYLSSQRARLRSRSVVTFLSTPRRPKKSRVDPRACKLSRSPLV